MALRNDFLDYGVWSQADLVIRVPIDGGTHVAMGRSAGGTADHQIRPLPMPRTTTPKNRSSAALPPLSSRAAALPTPLPATIPPMRLPSLLLLSLLCFGCSSSQDSTSPSVTWAIAIHGGAGTIPKTLPAERIAAYERSLEAALREGTRLLAAGTDALVVAESVVKILEDDPLFNAGRGAVYTNAGTHELDACIMDGRDLSCGAVAAVRTVRHPIELARLVMRNTRHILLAGDGAEKFADEMGVERVANSWFDTDYRLQILREVQAEEAAKSHPSTGYGTVGAVVRDARGHLAAATSTGGLTNKRFGRIGDTPLVGAGNFADDATCAVSCTGTGEVFMRHGVAREMSALVRYRGANVQDAAREIIHQRLNPDDGGLIAVGADGSLAMEFNSAGMYRGAANSTGRFEVAIWEAP